MQKCAKYEMKPVQYAQVSYFAHFSRLLFVISRSTDTFFSFFFFWGGGGDGGCGGGDIGSFY